MRNINRAIIVRLLANFPPIFERLGSFSFVGWALVGIDLKILGSISLKARRHKKSLAEINATCYDRLARTTPATITDIPRCVMHKSMKTSCVSAGKQISYFRAEYQTSRNRPLGNPRPISIRPSLCNFLFPSDTYNYPRLRPLRVSWKFNKLVRTKFIFNWLAWFEPSTREIILQLSYEDFRQNFASQFLANGSSVLFREKKSLFRKLTPKYNFRMWRSLFERSSRNFEPQ